jgi:C1A family cysteine protease
MIVPEMLLLSQHRETRVEQSFNLPELQAALQRDFARWSAGENSMTQLTKEERLKRLGYAPGPGEPTPEQREQIASANRSQGVASAAYPASFDLRNVDGKNFITPIRDQGACGSCVAFGTVATIEGTARFQKRDPNFAIDLSEAQLFYCMARSQGRNCGNGWWVPPAMDVVRDQGLADEACYPYTAGDQNCSNLCSDWQNRVTKTTSWHQIGNPSDIKTWVSTKGPVGACFNVYDDFFAYTGGVYHHVTGSLAGGHCVSIVGYNDSGGYWICKNSWNTGWGESGFFRIAYGECGIDAVGYAADGIVDTGWFNAKHIQGLWAIDQDRNAFAFIESAGWKKVAPDNDNIFFNLLVELAAAKLANRPCNVYVESGLIHQLYVL